MFFNIGAKVEKQDNKNPDEAREAEIQNKKRDPSSAVWIPFKMS
jgi:hypothetical protein